MALGPRETSEERKRRSQSFRYRFFLGPIHWNPPPSIVLRAERLILASFHKPKRIYFYIFSFFFFSGLFLERISKVRPKRLLSGECYIENISKGVSCNENIGSEMDYICTVIVGPMYHGFQDFVTYFFPFPPTNCTFVDTFIRY